VWIQPECLINAHSKGLETAVEIPLFPSQPSLQEAAQQIAAAFHLSIIDVLPSPPSALPPWLLQLTPECLQLCDTQSAMKPVSVDFVGGALDYRRRHGGGRRQPLGKAIGLSHGKTPTVVDATAGLGRDAFILACLGCQVQMVERSKVVAALLFDGLRRAQLDSDMGTLVRERLQLIHLNACEWLARLPDGERPEVIYLDPMYPHRHKSALVKKEMRICRAVVGDDEDAPVLLTVALECARRRVVVKRPKGAPTLTGTTPSFCIESENTRFDVYVQI
jgi:16S rRNA (guanine1516-N2)-methyltransferase